MNKQQFAGMYTALVTPQDEHGKLDLASLERHVQRQIACGVHGFYVAGSTGEAFLLSERERQELLEAVIGFTGGRAKIIAHIGAIGTDETIRLAAHAREAGADAISALPPIYFKFRPQEIKAHYEAVMARVDLPLIVYNNPANTGFNLTPDFFADLARNPRCLGVKFTSLNLYELQQIRARCGEEFLIYNGHEQVYAGGALMGADGAIGSSFNVMPRHMVDMYDKLRQGDWDSALPHQIRANELLTHMFRYDGIAFLKRILYLQGVLRHPHSRMPLRRLTDAEEAEIASIYEQCELLR